MDIDIDLRADFDPGLIMKQAIPASIVKNGELTKHPCGHYLQTMPIDAHTGLAAIPHKEAEQFGFFKFDFLHIWPLDYFTSKHEMRRLLQIEPDWSLLEDPKQVEKLFQINRQADLVTQLKPRSIQELADCIAIIRPGKARLLQKYLKDKIGTRKELYVREEDGPYSFKKGHALAYAHTIVLCLHLIMQGKL